MFLHLIWKLKGRRLTYQMKVLRDVSGLSIERKRLSGAPILTSRCLDHRPFDVQVIGELKNHITTSYAALQQESGLACDSAKKIHRGGVQWPYWRHRVTCGIEMSTYLVLGSICACLAQKQTFRSCLQCVRSVESLTHV